MITREEYEANLKARMREMQLEIDRLKAELELAAAESRIDLQQQVETMKDQQQRAQEKLKELGDAGSDAWEDMKIGVQESVDILAESVKSATRRFL